MEHGQKVVDSIKFLLSSVKKLSDSFLESEDKVKRSLDRVRNEVDNLQKRIESLERNIADLNDGNLVMGRAVLDAELPLVEDTRDHVIPALNLSSEQIIDVYSNTPVLLVPFCRPCSLSGRTLSGEIDDVELEVFSQGSTWALETRDEGCLLIPRPGSLDRRTQVHSLERLYEIEGVRSLPAILHLLRPAKIEAVEFGKRWQLREKGVLSVNPDPIKKGTSDRSTELEQRLSMLELKGSS
jgi:hypothetical protein